TQDMFYKLYSIAMPYVLDSNSGDYGVIYVPTQAPEQCKMANPAPIKISKKQKKVSLAPSTMAIGVSENE
ncbi:hypothetical protein J1N35_020505, partial [Gossypium stocksii]